MLTTTLASAVPVAAEVAKGRVFNDLNTNTLLDANEPGIPGVRVSDGHTITLTDAKGDWSLDVDDPALIFVVKPNGYRTPVSDDQLPQFYYIHQPEGSPTGLRYPGIEPTGPLPAQINFALYTQTEPTSFEAILFADPQPQTEIELDYIRDDVVAELIGTRAKFGMTMGDIMFDDLSLFPRYNAIVGRIGVPWYNVPGNHEMNLLATDDASSLETFKRYFGPPYYSFEYGGALFVILDNIEYQGNGKSDPGDVRGSGGYIANFGKSQLAWLKSELTHVDKDTLVFVAMHAPLSTTMSDAEGVTTADRAKLFRLLSGRKNLYSVAGHTHTTEHVYYDRDDGFRGPGKLHHHVLSTVSGSWWGGPFDETGVPTAWQRDGTPNGYHVLEVNGEQATVRFKAAGKSERYQMRIMFDVAHHGLRPDGLRDFRAGELLDSRIHVDHVPAAAILVNLFDGGPNSSVTFRIDDGPSHPLRRVDRRDPMIIEMFARNPETKKSWVSATSSTHLFEADLPDALTAGVYTVSVAAIDEFGREHHSHAVLEITGR